MLVQTIDQKYGRDHDSNQGDHQTGELMDTSIKGCCLLHLGDVIRQTAKKTIAAGFDNQADPIARNNIGAHETKIVCFKHSLACRMGCLTALFRRHGFTGQCRLIDE